MREFIEDDEKRYKQRMMDFYHERSAEDMEYKVPYGTEVVVMTLAVLSNTSSVFVGSVS